MLPPATSAQPLQTAKSGHLAGASQGSWARYLAVGSQLHGQWRERWLRSVGAFCADGVTLFQIRCWCLAHRFGAWRQVKGFSARCLINRSGAYCLVGFKVCGAARLPSRQWHISQYAWLLQVAGRSPLICLAILTMAPSCTQGQPVASSTCDCPAHAVSCR